MNELMPEIIQNPKNRGFLAQLNQCEKQIIQDIHVNQNGRQTPD